MIRVKFHLIAENHRPMGGCRKSDLLVVQRGWLTCCQSPDHHRFDCSAQPPDKRGKPYLLATPPTARQLVDRVRIERAARSAP